MKKLCLMTGVTLGGLIGWRLGDSYGLMTAYLLSFAGSLVGVVLSVIFYQRYLD